ncbi:RES family NAD+ phosphorylase [Algoriphagus halophytocola]|uniref:RES family NAD+ phosphorylase n=1 Tax=Algoriphagus halophytocola TaxID=2991499 RepID=A0ABY6ML54_9BACT|nr:RES family NAD+ phosphorylase [Algoriphagus sp. TR-M5]UZD24497.1 RES family NAD+ phosphorylase [Algoriphagus sp. TR-M5]
MKIYRLSKSKYAFDLSGKGAELAGGRWNSKGKAVLYTSQSRALCTAEIAVHTPLGNVPTDYELVEITIPDTIAMKEIVVSDLPKDWKSIPHSHSTQEIGDKFLSENDYLIFKVPSVVVQGDFNFLINPAHRQFYQVEITSTEPFDFDSRFFSR